MKIHLTGLPEQADADELRERMSRFGPVEDFLVLREYMGDDPVWVVVMNVDAGTATEIVRRIDNIRHQGRFIHARVPLYQDQPGGIRRAVVAAPDAAPFAPRACPRRALPDHRM